MLSGLVRTGGKKTGTPLRVLILEDSEDDSLLILRELKQGGFEPDHLRVETREDMADALDADGWDIIIADYLMPGFNALEALRLVRDQGIDLPFIIVSGSIGEETAVEAMQAGARDYLMKGNLARLASAVARELEEARLRRAHLRAEEELRVRERQLSYIYSNISEVIYYLSVEEDERFRFLSVNQAFLDVTGLPEDQVVGKYVDEVIPEPSLTLVLTKYRQAIRDDETVKWEEVTDYPAGTKYGEVAVTPVFDANGVCTGLVGSVHDVTERKAVEESLRESEERFRILSDQSLMGIQILQDGMIKYANEATARICGYPIEEIMIWGPEDYAKMFFPDDRPFVLEQARRKQAGEEDLETDYEWRLINHAGETRWIQSFSKTIPYGEGPADFVMITDVTERKRTMDRLEMLNRCFLSLGPDPRENVVKILATGRDILGAISLKYCCRTRSLQYHYSDSGTRSEPLAKNEGCCYILDDGLAAGQAFVPDIERIPPEERRPDVDGQSLRSLLAVPIKIGEELVGSLCLFDTAKRDFTIEERELLIMLARAIGIEEDRFHHEESLRDFLAVAAHELRHPICLVQGYANTLVDFRQDMTQEMLSEIYESISVASRRLINLVEELLEVSRIEKERFHVDRSEVEPQRILERVVEEMRERGVGNPFEIRMAARVGAWSLDQDKFQQLMVILLDNAVNYSPPGSPVEVEMEETMEGLSLSVLDRGRGVSAAERGRIFQRFYQVEDPRHHSVPGLGLGLYIAREIVEGHGGRIWCEPRGGGGSAFRFTLPR